jgi:galactitol-specific phosphotransferase system IIC component
MTFLKKAWRKNRVFPLDDIGAFAVFQALTILTTRGRFLGGAALAADFLLGSFHQDRAC